MLSSLDVYGKKSYNERYIQVFINHCAETWQRRQNLGSVEGGSGSRGYKADSWVPQPDWKGRKLKTLQTFSLQTQATTHQCT
jgi:hypothetical protein